MAQQTSPDDSDRKAAGSAVEANPGAEEHGTDGFDAAAPARHAPTETKTVPATAPPTENWVVGYLTVHPDLEGDFGALVRKYSGGDRAAGEPGRFGPVRIRGEAGNPKAVIVGSLEGYAAALVAGRRTVPCIYDDGAPAEDLLRRPEADVLPLTQAFQQGASAPAALAPTTGPATSRRVERLAPSAPAKQPAPPPPPPTNPRSALRRRKARGPDRTGSADASEPDASIFVPPPLPGPGQGPAEDGQDAGTPTPVPCVPLADLPVEAIAIPDIDLGPVRHSAEQLRQLATTLDDLGSVHAPVVRRHGRRFKAITGVGRIAARKLRGATTVRAIVVPEDPAYDLLVEYWQGVENCVRVAPPTHERDALLARNQEIYEKLHPESASATAKRRAGSASAAKRWVTGEAASPVTSSTAATAAATGRSLRSVQLAASRLRRAAPEVTNAYQRGELKATQVDEVTKLSKEAQGMALPDVVGRSRAETRRIVQRLRQPSSRQAALPTPAALVRGAHQVLDALGEPLGAVDARRDEIVGTLDHEAIGKLRDRLLHAADVLRGLGLALGRRGRKPAQRGRGKPGKGRATPVGKGRGNGRSR